MPNAAPAAGDSPGARQTDPTDQAARLRDASAEQPRYPDPGPLDAETFAAAVRMPQRIGDRLRTDGRHMVEAGELNLFLRAAATLATHATDEAIIFRRRPEDVRAEFELKRRPFFRLCAAAEAVERLRRAPAGVRGVVEYRLARQVAAKSATGGTARAKSATGGTARAAKSATGGTARLFPAFTDQDDHHHHQGERASRAQIRKACALDRAAGRVPDEDRYQAMSRADIWDHIAAQEPTKAPPEPEPVPEPVPEPELTAADRDRAERHDRKCRVEAIRSTLANGSMCVRLGPAKVDELRAELARSEHAIARTWK